MDKFSEKVEGVIGTTFFLILGAVIIIFLWPGIVSVFIGNYLLDFPGGLLILILCDIVLGLAFLGLGFSKLNSYLKINGLVFLVVAIIFSINYIQGFISPTAFGNRSYIDSQVADHYHLLEGELTPSYRRSWFHEVWFAQKKDERLERREERKQQNLPDARECSRIVRQFIRAVSKMNAIEAEKYLIENHSSIRPTLMRVQDKYNPASVNTFQQEIKGFAAYRPETAIISESEVLVKVDEEYDDYFIFELRKIDDEWKLTDISDFMRFIRNW